MYLDGYREEIRRWVQEGLSDARIAERVRVSPSVARPPRRKAETPREEGAHE